MPYQVWGVPSGLPAWPAILAASATHIIIAVAHIAAIGIAAATTLTASAASATSAASASASASAAALAAAASARGRNITFEEDAGLQALHRGKASRGARWV